MKITAPVQALGEIELLAAAGADEFYCGLIPREWHVKYTVAVWINRRGPQGGNLFTMSALAKLTAAAHRLNRRVFLTLNAPQYSREQIADVNEVARRAAEEAGVDAFIVSDIGLMRCLKSADLDVEIHTSSLSHVLNEEAVRMQIDLGADRIILPRHLSAAELSHLVRRVPDVAFECFILNDGCVYEEGFCLTAHNADRLHAFCRHPWTRTLRTARRATATYDDWQRHVADYERYLDDAGAVACSGAPLPGGALAPCGLCALHRFSAAGLHSVKIVGREAPLTKKVQSVRLVRRVMDLVDRGASERDTVHEAVAARGDRSSCLTGRACYYRDTWRPGWMTEASEESTGGATP